MRVQELLTPECPAQADEPIYYPEDDGNPMSNNTKQFEYITVVKNNLDILVREEESFVAGGLLWYPIKGDNKTRMAPDVMVVLGRPKGHRGSYQQWNEANIPPQVVFEILSPGNRTGEMAEKFRFYQEHGVREYYIYDPQKGTLAGWTGGEWGLFDQINEMDGWVSPRLGIYFELVGKEMQLLFPDGTPFLSFVELNEQRKQAEARVKREERIRIHEERRRVQAEMKVKEVEGRIQEEMEARQEVEVQLQKEAEARQEAEARAQVAEAEAKTMEARLREMEEKLWQAGL